jgi:hypothetical protein
MTAEVNRNNSMNVNENDGSSNRASLSPISLTTSAAQQLTSYVCLNALYITWYNERIYYDHLIRISFMSRRMRITEMIRKNHY